MINDNFSMVKNLLVLSRSVRNLTLYWNRFTTSQTSMVIFSYVTTFLTYQRKPYSWSPLLRLKDLSRQNVYSCSPYETLAKSEKFRWLIE